MSLLSALILGLLAATCSIQGKVQARALTATTRSTDITCGGQFPKAGDGFAKRPDGCSSWSDNPAQVRDKWGSANFGTACDEHDRCYYTVGANVDGCNDNFCGSLRKACRHAYCKKIKVLTASATICEPVTYGSCTAIAETYCAAVKSVAADVYVKAQDLQKRYNSCLADNGGLTPPPALVLCSNGRPEGATWKEGVDGMKCLIGTYTCRSGKIVLLSSVHPLGCIEP